MAAPSKSLGGVPWWRFLKLLIFGGEEGARGFQKIPPQNYFFGILFMRNFRVVEFFFVLKDLGGNAEKDFGRDPSGLQSIRLRWKTDYSLKLQDLRRIQ